MTYTLKDLENGFRKTGISKDDLVMVHSSYKSIGEVEGRADTVIDALVNLGGVIFFPTYTISSWCKYHYFDHKESPSEMGIIPEIARTREGTYRTRHPIHSFAIIGEWSNDFSFENIESFEPKKSPYALFHERNGLVISIGVPWNDTISFVHYVEQMAEAAFRRNGLDAKPFAGTYVDGWGFAKLETYRMSVRKTLRHITHVVPLYEQVLLPKGVVKMTKVGDADVAYFRCKEYFDTVAPLVKTNPELFHEVK